MKHLPIEAYILAFMVLLGAVVVSTMASCAVKKDCLRSVKSLECLK